MIVTVLYLLVQEQGFPIIVAPFAEGTGKSSYLFLFMSFCPVFLIGREFSLALLEQGLN